jgi:hypothetical protein
VAQTETQIVQIAASIKEFGFTNPVLLDGECGIDDPAWRNEAGRSVNAQTCGTRRVRAGPAGRPVCGPARFLASSMLTIGAVPRARVCLTFEHLTSLHMIRRSILWYRAPVEHLNDKWRNSAVFG